MAKMQFPSEEETPCKLHQIIQREKHEDENNITYKPNDIRHMVEKEKESTKEDKREDQEEKEEEDERDSHYSKSPISSAYYSTLSSFDNENERRIPLDAVSLTEIGMFEEDGPLSMPDVFTEVTVQSPVLPPVRTPRFVSASLPCSANSSPHYASSNNRWDEPNLRTSSVQSPCTLARQHSVALTHFAMTRNMSFAEGRTFAHNDTFHVIGVMRQNNSDRSPGSSSSTSSESPKTKPKTKSTKEDDFKCGALCMHLPSFSKKKQIQLWHQVTRANGGVSRLASREKKDCGSWSPRNLPNGNACDPDTPVEMERSSTHDTESPIHTAFLFEGVEKRGILKKNSSRFGSSKSMGMSNRHVRFSVTNNSPAASCPSSPVVSSVCMSPRLRAREEFSAFLEAVQSA